MFSPSPVQMLIYLKCTVSNSNIKNKTPPISASYYRLIHCCFYLCTFNFIFVLFMDTWKWKQPIPTRYRTSLNKYCIIYLFVYLFVQWQILEKNKMKTCLTSALNLAIIDISIVFCAIFFICDVDAVKCQLPTVHWWAYWFSSSYT